MPSSRNVFQRTCSRLLSLVIIAALLTGCQMFPASPEPEVIQPAETQVVNQQALAEVTFEVQVPEKLAEGQSLSIEFLDEVTGLALNPLQARMSSEDGLKFTLTAPFPLGTVLKYRYLVDNMPVGSEYTSLGKPVRYRLYAVEGPGIVWDIIAAWKSRPAGGSQGRIQGQVANKANNTPVVNALIAAGGMQTLTASDGTFLLEGLLPGTHNLVVYSLNGEFAPFQQGAVVAPDSTTPALILLQAAKTVSVTFIADPPEDAVQGAPVRLVGSIYALGSTFADLRGGSSVLPSRAPVMSVKSDGTYAVTLKLPAGLDLRYKYTLGDGFWNAERDANGGVRTRQLIIPDEDVIVKDTIDTWRTYGAAPVTFEVTVPGSTLVADTVSIQFNPYGWTEPIPMWPQGDNRWSFTLYNPLDVFSSAAYRYCRNDQCGSADAAETMGPAAKGMTFSPSETEQRFEDRISSWAWFDAAAQPVTVSAAPVTERGQTFQAGAQWLAGYHPSWQPYMTWAFQNLKDAGANTVMLSPTWHFTHQAPPVIEPLPGQDALWPDLTQSAVQAQRKGLGIAIHPVLAYPVPAADWWQAAPRDDGWWQSWFDRYTTFMIHHADLAAQTGAKMLVIGDESIAPSLPGGVLVDGSSSKVPADAADRWSKLIAAVRARYKGRLAWMVPYAGSLAPMPEFAAQADLLYLQITPPLTGSDQPSQAEVEAAFAKIMDEEVLKLQEKTGQPVIIGLQYPSVTGAFDGCVDSEGTCLPPAAFLRPAPYYPSTQLGLSEQAVVYSAALSVINERSWIAGFYAAGYHPAVEMKDMSTSVRYKPAGDVLWYWYPRLLGQVTP